MSDEITDAPPAPSGLGALNAAPTADPDDKKPFVFDHAKAAVALPPASQLADSPVDWAKHLLVTRAGVPPTKDGTKDGETHPLRQGLVHTHATHRSDPDKGIVVRMLPADFRWPDPEPRTVTEALAALDAAAV